MRQTKTHHHRLLLLLSIVLAGPLVAQEPSDTAREVLGPELLDLVVRADAVAVYAVDPEPAADGEPHIGGCRIRREVRLEAAGVAAVRAALVDRATYGGAPANCFVPHHALRLRAGPVAGSLLICFDCYQMRWVEGERTICIEGEGPLLDAVENLLAKRRGDEPDGAEASLERAADLLAEGRLDEAREALERSIARRPDVGRAYRLRATIYLRSKDYERALADLDRALAIDPDDAGALADRASVRSALGDEVGALADCDRALAIDPRSYVARLNRGVARTRLRRFEEAIEDFRTAVEIAPDRYQGWVNLGVLYAQLGRRAEARQAFERARVQAPDDVAEGIDRRLEELGDE